ncbi:MAG TPA: SOS response-associated peptidase [Candidatus Limnocylindrales bacterium]|nr:SOS response-associated peptidase [Candidatus Limnocylindrales bacterium]
MCGRFVLHTPGEALARHFGAVLDELSLRPQYNIAPTQDVVVIRVEDGERRLRTLRWGLVPYWAKDAAIGQQMINARCETAAQKPGFREALRQRRAIVPADGFYEWKKQGRARQPYYFHARDNSPLAIAALWERWKSRDGQRLETCCLLTTSANTLVEGIHDRMPVLLRPQDYALWLDPAVTDPEAVAPLLAPADDQQLVMYPVDSCVGDVRNDDERNIARADTGELPLFNR